jgi:hypothetical protein
MHWNETTWLVTLPMIQTTILSTGDGHSVLELFYSVMPTAYVVNGIVATALIKVGQTQQHTAVAAQPAAT